MMSCCAPAAAADVQRVVMCAPGGGQLRAVSACAQEPGGAFHPASHKELGDDKAMLGRIWGLSLSLRVCVCGRKAESGCEPAAPGLGRNVAGPQSNAGRSRIIGTTSTTCKPNSPNVGPRSTNFDQIWPGID